MPSVRRREFNTLSRVALAEDIDDGRLILLF